MAPLDATIPTDSDLVSTYAELIRGLREKCNELEALITAGSVFTAERVEVLSYAMSISENFLLADAADGEQTILLPNPAEMYVGVEYKVKKIDATENKVVLPAYGATKIDNADSVELLLPNEVVTFVTDGENLWTV